MKRFYMPSTAGILTLVISVSLAVFSPVYGQAVRLSDKPEQFMGELQKLMATGGPVSARAQKNLQALWEDSRLTPQQRERIMALSRKMNAKRLQPVAHFTPFYEALSLYHASYTQQPAVSAQELDNLLTIAEKTFESNDPKVFAKALETVRLFLSTRQLYAGNYNKLYAHGGTLSFRYLDAAGNAISTQADGKTTETESTTATPAAQSSRFDGWDDPIPLDSGKTRPIGQVFIPQKRPIPTVTGAVLTLNNSTLVMVANGDSAVLSETSGNVLLKDGIWVGKGGKFTWELAGRPDIFVTMDEYSFPIISPRIAADDVTLTMGQGAKPIKGVFEYLSKKRGPNQPVTYPRFMSWQSDVAMPGLGTDIDYKGGLALSGMQLIGASASGQLSVLIVKHNGKPAFRATSRRFEFVDSLITAPVASFAGYVETDSVTHPAVQFKFNRTERIAWLNKIDRLGYGKVPYADSYHKFYIQPEVVRWDLPRRKVDFYQVGAKREVPIHLESFDYFDPQRYTTISVDYGFHPLQIAANYISTKKTQTFLPDDLAQFAKVNFKSLSGALDRMVREGYIIQDPNSGWMRLSRKGVLYVLAYAKKGDYDNFQFQSVFVSNDSTKNATIDLKDNFLTVRGVERFVISDSLKIFGMPSDKTLRIGKGRSFKLNGQLKAGTFRYSGRDLAFDYDKFSMALSKIDSITFTPKKLAAQGKSGEIGGDIKYDKSGTIFLGSADNKSGNVKGKKTTQRLVMPEGVTIYFNQPERGNRTYTEKVYLKIPAIDNDSIGKADLAFSGTFHSDGIFPPFKTELKTMPDNTLGFVHKAPAAGYPVYGSKSNVKFAGELIMNKEGLQAAGTLNHLTATLKTDGLLFMQDSVVATGKSGQIREGTVGKGYFPGAQLNDFSMKWWPKLDSMAIVTKGNSFKFYNGTTNLEGHLVLRSTGLFGNGSLSRKDVEAVSKSFKFNKEGFLADNADLKILTDKQAGKPILVGKDVDVDFNQVKGIVNLAINKKGHSIDDTLQSSFEFPFAGYKTSINRAQWNMNAKTIAMKGDVKTSSFTATAEEQEGLSFNGTAALYEVEKMALNISGVPYVTSADARIYPDKGLVSIKRNGEMMELKKARLELDTVSLHHRLKNGNIKILSRTRFSGDGTYQFATAAGDTASIKMGSFDLKEAPVLASNAPVADTRSARRRSSQKPLMTYFSVAKAEIAEDDKLILAPKMQFKGSIAMQAPEKDLAIEGYIMPALKKRPTLVSGWIPFKEKVVESIDIKVDKNLKNEGDQPLVAGIHYRIGSTGLYPTFLSAKEDPKDEDIFTATGIMRYDPKEKAFRIISKTADGLDDVEGAFTFNDDKGVMAFKGPLTLMNTAPNNYLEATGSARINIDSALYRLNTFMLFNFPMAEQLNTVIAEKIVKANLEEKNDEAAEDDLNRLSDKLNPIIGQKAVEEYRIKAQNQHVPLVQAAPKLNAMMVLSNVNLRWSEKYNAFYSTGKVGVSNMNLTDINAQMDGFVEIRKGAAGDEVSIYLESSPDIWFFYDYRPGQLAIVTSDQELNDRITAGSKKRSSLSVVSAGMDEKVIFVDRYLDQYKTRTKAAPKAPAAKVVKKEEEKKKDKEEEKEGF
ncbi:hypothetical protein GCM10023189_02160 [Nibrella saemangeumensis]|uniref:Uncharacterized protein n=1 Tax=Nibrella saemangeumensis TaxID=1084526 RepID=A0ABP8MBA8_9BACT